MSYNNDDFTVLKNGVDSRMGIICHSDTGFYNITKGIEMLSRLKGHPLRLTLNQLLDEEDTKEMIATCKKVTHLETILFEVKSGTHQQFMGVYVHQHMYDYLLWHLCGEYAMKIADRLNNHRAKLNQEREAREKSIRRVADQLNAKIKQLEMANQ